MGDKVRAGRGMDGRDAVRKAAAWRVRTDAGRSGSATTDAAGREQQRRAVAWGRARGQA